MDSINVEKSKKLKHKIDKLRISKCYSATIKTSELNFKNSDSDTTMPHPQHSIQSLLLN